jgi:hypothetical protein
VRSFSTGIKGPVRDSIWNVWESDSRHRNEGSSRVDDSGPYAGPAGKVTLTFVTTALRER